MGGVGEIRYKIKILNKIFDYKIYIQDISNKNIHTNIIYIQYLKELIFAKSKSTSNNCPLTTIASSSPKGTFTGHIKNQYKVVENILY